MLTEKDYCDLDTSHELWVMGLEPEAYYDGPLILLYEAQKWLREEKDIHIEVYACAGGYIYELCKAYKPNSFSGGTTIYTPNDVDNPKLNDAGRYDDFEEALSEGIKEAVKILTNNKNE
jgi:hypothetical protein